MPVRVATGLRRFFFLRVATWVYYLRSAYVDGVARVQDPRIAFTDILFKNVTGLDKPNQNALLTWDLGSFCSGSHP